MSVYQFVRAKKTGDPFTKAVLIALAHYANWEHGYCYPSAETLAEDCECSERTVRRRLEELEQAGLIRLDPRPGKTPMVVLIGYREWFLDNEKRARATPATPVTQSGVPKLTPDSQSKTPDCQSLTPDCQSDELIKEHIKEQSCNGKADSTTCSSGVFNGTVDTEPSSKTTTTQSSGQTDLNELAKKLEQAAAACLDDPVNCQSLANLSVPLTWLASGCSLDLDIVPTLAGIARSRAGKGVRSWSYFTKAVQDARDKRLRSGQISNSELPSFLPDPGPDHHWVKDWCTLTGKRKWYKRRKTVAA